MSDSIFKPVFSALREQREALGWSQSEAARQAGIARSTVTRLEQGNLRCRFSKLVALTEALGLSLEFASTDQ